MYIEKYCRIFLQQLLCEYHVRTHNIIVFSECRLYLSINFFMILPYIDYTFLQIS